MELATLTRVDSAEVTNLVDGFVDVLMAGSDVARRPPLVPDLFERDQLRAEHGYALLLTVVQGGRRRSVLHDAGPGRDTALYNLDVLEVSRCLHPDRRRDHRAFRGGKRPVTRL